MDTAFLISVSAVAVAALLYWALLTWLIGDDEIVTQEPEAPQSIRELTEGRILRVGDRFISERELLAQMGATYQPPTLHGKASKGFDQQLRAVSGGKPKREAAQ